MLEENRRRAARDGLEARLIDLEDDTERPAADAIRALVSAARPRPTPSAAREELELVEQILVCGNGADEQLRVYDETGGSPRRGAAARRADDRQQPAPLAF